MSKIVIEGSRRIKGEIQLQGSKNSVLPILAATIVCGDECVIHNCPKLSDVEATFRILRYLGCKVYHDGEVAIVDSRSMTRYDIPDYLMREMRSSIIFLGALISRIGKAKMTLPGGCELGPRPVDLHIDALKQLGVIIDESYGILECETCSGGVKGCNIVLSFPSVGATENIILAGVMAKGTTVITNAAREPEICDLANYLNKCGANIKGAGEGTIVIEGTEKMHGTEYAIMSDRIVEITYMAAAAITGGELLICNSSGNSIGAVIPIFEEAGCLIETPEQGKLKIQSPGRLYSNRLIRTMPYPGFPTDAQAPVMAMTTVADGTTMFVENIFENRYKHTGELLRMGADIKVEGRVAMVEGVKNLYGASVTATDLRGAAALVVAGLGAQGITTIEGLSHIDRGYEEIEEKLSSVGASVKRV